MKQVTKGDLKCVKNQKLRCNTCDMMWSADPNDYWFVTNEYVFTCIGNVDFPHEEENMILVVPKVVYEEVQYP